MLYGEWFISLVPAASRKTVEMCVTIHSRSTHHLSSWDGKKHVAEAFVYTEKLFSNFGHVR